MRLLRHQQVIITRRQRGYCDRKNRDTALLCFNSAFFHGFFAQIRYWMIFCGLHVFLYTLRFSKTIQPELKQRLELIEDDLILFCQITLLGRFKKLPG